jgi:hypothetical protein
LRQYLKTGLGGRPGAVVAENASDDAEERDELVSTAGH